ncbi:stage II sporulation protein AB (anti-sigma F factor) [Lachnospiraceae bacterium XBB1006]|nr:stage II sporulation protein AB (anti-sigma F factor) [Lachnospiraceae bacterium XBB1006]
MSDVENYMKVEFEGISENERLARMLVSAFVVTFNPTLEELEDVKTATSEAVTNCIIHGYEQLGGPIEMTMEKKGQELFLQVADYGIGICDVEKAMEPLFTTKPQLDRSGMGFTFMEAFMDEVKVHSVKGKGTVVHMKKIFGSTCKRV